MGLLSGGGGLGLGGNPLNWNGEEWLAFSGGGSQFVGAHQALEEIRGSAAAPAPIDERIDANLALFQVDPSDPSPFVDPERLAGRLKAAGLNAAAAGAAAGRLSTRGYLSSAPAAIDYTRGLSRLEEEARRQAQAIGSTPTPHVSQLQHFLGAL